MSEIRNALVTRNRILVGSSRPGPWQSLRLVVHRSQEDWLTAGLIETTWAGASALDTRVRGLQFQWDPRLASGADLRLYALNRAITVLSQTEA